MNTPDGFSRSAELPADLRASQWIVNAESVPPVAPVADPQTEAVLAALAQKAPDRTWVQGLVLLAVTLVLFASTGLFSSTPADILMLVGVLLFHELGHYVGMRLFNYQDVKMFFIPFFGAAVSGRATSVAGYKEAIVLLLGPVPGIALGVVLGAVCMFRDLPQLRQLSMLLLALNAFNLLPLLPLDGGRLVQLIIFSRQRHIEALFRVLVAVLLGLLA